MRNHLEENILPGVALYQTLLEDEHTRERAMQLVEEAFEEWGTSNQQVMERLGRLSIFYWLLRAMVKVGVLGIGHSRRPIQMKAQIMGHPGVP